MQILTQNIAEQENRHTSGAYAKRPLALVRGSGCRLYDDAGREYLDLGSGVGVALLGHAHPAISQAVAQQAHTLITCHEGFYNDRRAELYAALADLLPGGISRFFLCNSGAEAVEGALKVARLLTGRTRIVSVKRGFHGRTLGALATTWNPAYREPFAGWTPPTTFVSPADLASAEAAITDDTAAVIVEAVQGEGGVYPLDAAYLQGLRDLCTARGALLIADEIQAGLGRTGRWFGFEHAGITPDIVTLGKGVAGGVPMGVVAWRGALGQLESGIHGSTFGGNPLACAAASANLAALRQMNAPVHAGHMGAWLLNTLRDRRLTNVREIRGIGLMVGLELRVRVTPVLQALQERGIIALLAGKTVLRLLPPLIITQEELASAVDTLAEVLASASQQA
jgi:acetylornithine/LysW-gamma-L-lysine aminotransferase